MKSGKNQYICSAGRNKILSCPGFVLSREKKLQWRASEFSHLQHPTQRNMEFWLLCSSAHDYWISEDQLFAPKLFPSISLMSAYRMIIRVFRCEWFRQQVCSKWRKDETMEVKVALQRYHYRLFLEWWQFCEDVFAFELHIYLFRLLWWYWISRYWFNKWNLRKKHSNISFFFFFTKNHLSTWSIG